MMLISRLFSKGNRRHFLADCIKYKLSRDYSARSSLHVELLKQRTILKLSGSDVNNYLQGMVTNDVRKVEDTPALYSLLLNASGRVMYDLILYKTGGNEYMVEYDATAVEYLHRHLLMYRLRKNVKFEPLTNLAVWAIYEPNDNNNPHLLKIMDHLNQCSDVLMCVKDPRCNYMGLRVLTDRDADLYEQLKKLEVNIITDNSYNTFRYQLGVGEGVLDHPPGNCLPFETNVDLLNGVSFTKGCYIGQEMTARSNFTLVIRKRLMPVILEDKDSYPEFPPECTVLDSRNRKVGRLRSHLGRYGLGLLKYEDCEKCDFLHVKDLSVKLKAVRPKWWPSDLKSE